MVLVFHSASHKTFSSNLPLLSMYAYTSICVCVCVCVHTSCFCRRVCCRLWGSTVKTSSPLTCWRKRANASLGIKTVLKVCHVVCCCTVGTGMCRVPVWLSWTRMVPGQPSRRTEYDFFIRLSCWVTREASWRRYYLFDLMSLFGMPHGKLHTSIVQNTTIFLQLAENNCKECMHICIQYCPILHLSYGLATVGLAGFEKKNLYRDHCMQIKHALCLIMLFSMQN